VRTVNQHLTNTIKYDAKLKYFRGNEETKYRENQDLKKPKKKKRKKPRQESGKLKTDLFEAAPE
jgi:hypothetical protein